MAETDDQRLAAVLRELNAVEVEPEPHAGLTFGADQTVVESHSGGLTRSTQALAAAMSPSTHFVEYEQRTEDGGAVRLWVGTHRVRATRAGFVLVLLAFGAGSRRRDIVAALRLYPTGTTEETRWFEAPALALATLIARYGAEYEVEQGRRTVFQPFVDFERQRFVMNDRVELPEVTEALGFDYNEDALMAVLMMRPKSGGGVNVCFPMMFRTEAYLADVAAATG